MGILAIGRKSIEAGESYQLRELSISYVVPERKLFFSPISASDKNFNPQNT